MPLKRVGRRVATAVGTLTADARMAPAFILAGAQRCGTTSLYRALMSHPDIVPPILHKGINYFDVNYHKGSRWYRGHFPLHRRGRASGATSLAFEASGYYMFHPHAPRRIIRDLPDAKILVMLRDPVERAYSAYQHEFARGFETEPFHRALELEHARVEPELARMLDDPGYQSLTYRHHAYRRRGHYAEQLRPFIDALGPARVHVVESEQFFEEPAKQFSRLLTFLELPHVMPERFDRYNPRPRAPMDRHLRDELEQYFAPHDAALAEMLGRTPGWRL